MKARAGHSRGCWHAHLQEGDHVVVNEVAYDPLHPHAVVRVQAGRKGFQPDLMKLPAVAEAAQVRAGLRYKMVNRLHHIDCSKALTRSWASLMRDAIRAFSSASDAISVRKLAFSRRNACASSDNWPIFSSSFSNSEIMAAL